MDNSLSEYWFALSRDCPAKTWFYASLDRKPIYRQLRINPNDFGACYAVAPFRFARVDDTPYILAAHPTPGILMNPEPDWLSIETVFAWDPLNDTACILGDDAHQIAGAMHDEANQIFASPRAFFQAWAMRRAAFFAQWHSTVGKDWTSPPRERDVAPGALLIGDINKVRLSPSALPEHIETVGIDPKDVNRAIMRAARLPRATAAASHLRKAA